MKTLIQNRKGLFFILVVLSVVYACGMNRDYTIIDFQNDYDSVKVCLMENGHIQTVNIPGPNYIIIPGDSVPCSQGERLGCYNELTMTITLPEQSNQTTIKHEFVEHVLHVTGAVGAGHQHGHPGFAQCGGLETRE